MIEQITALLLQGKTQREIARELHIASLTVRKVAKTLVLPDCKCGQPHGHKGWCSERLSRHPDRRHFVTHVLPERNRIITCKGKPKTLAHRNKISDASRIPGSFNDRRMNSPFHFQFEGLSLEMPFARVLRRGEIREMLNRLFWHGPDPCQALIEKEEWEEEYKYHRWQDWWKRARGVAAVCLLSLVIAGPLSAASAASKAHRRRPTPTPTPRLTPTPTPKPSPSPTPPPTPTPTPTLTPASPTPTPTPRTTNFAWNASTGSVTQYNFYRHDPTGYVKLGQVSAPTTSYTTTTSSGQKFVVTAQGPGGQSGYSNEVTVP